MTTYEWKEPAVRGTGRHNKLVTPELLELLQSKPGQWLSIGVQVRSSWCRSLANHHKGQIEVATRGNKGRLAEIFLRWVA